MIRFTDRQMCVVCFEIKTVWYIYTPTGKSLSSDRFSTMLLLLVTLLSSTQASPIDLEANPWKRLADVKLECFMNQPDYRKKNPPKNIILFIADGMGLSTVTAARYMKAHQAGMLAGTVNLIWDDWPTVGLMRTFNLDRMITDSAASATAMFGGTKVLYRTLGLSGIKECCECAPFTSDQRIETSLIRAQKKGLATGLVTTTRVTHATPAAAYAYAYDRDDEAIARVAKSNDTFICKDIASQLVGTEIDFNVVMGGGLNNFFDRIEKDGKLVKGNREDSRNLLFEWERLQLLKWRVHSVVQNRTELIKAEMENVEYLLGLFAPEHMNFEIENPPDQPTLIEMTRAAINLLSQRPRGYFLVIEGGRIDHAHHANQAKYALTETLAFESAVKMAVSMTNREETLIIVTADHSHPYNVVGEADRQKSVLDVEDKMKAKDDMAYLLSAYANGPGAGINQTRRNPQVPQRFDNSFQQQALVPLKYSTHSAEDVPCYAIGPYSELFGQTFDNTFMAYATMFALCLKPYENAPHCVRKNGAIATMWPRFWVLTTHLILRMMQKYLEK